MSNERPPFARGGGDQTDRSVSDLPADRSPAPQPFRTLADVARADDPPAVRVTAVTETGSDSLTGSLDEIRVSDDRIDATLFGGRNRRVWDLGAVWDADADEWAAPEVERRHYPDDAPTYWTTVGRLSDVTVLENLGAAVPVRGADYWHADGTLYRVVVPPSERDYDNNVLGYDLHGSKNTLEKVDPDLLLPHDEDHPDAGGGPGE